MLGHLMEWFYGGLGGIEQSDNSVAYKEALIAPQIVDGMDDVSTDFKTPYGTIVSKWMKTAEGIVVEVEIPVNTTAIIELPVKEGTEILENGASIVNSPDVKLVSQEGGKTTLRLGSGAYKFLIR